jgi:ABC-type polar amino acid transport system ATPase subunit
MRVPPQKERSPPTRADEAAGAPILELDRINKWFSAGLRRERLHVLKDVSLEVRKGEVLVVIGPSGSGKSTLLRCMNMLAPPDQGTLRFLGRVWAAPNTSVGSPLSSWRREKELCQLRTRMGMVFQHFNLFPHKTTLKNVMLAPMRVLGMSAENARERALIELERVGMKAKANAYPSQLSGGQKQRVAIARAMAMQPELMLFDEATSALDPEIIEDVLAQMKALAAGGMTMIVVTHEMGFAREVGTRIIFMDEGRIVEQGPARELIANPTHPRTKTFLRAIL